jgi:hypothetical protein
VGRSWLLAPHIVLNSCDLHSLCLPADNLIADFDGTICRTIRPDSDARPDIETVTRKVRFPFTHHPAELLIVFVINDNLRIREKLGLLVPGHTQVIKVNEKLVSFHNCMFLDELL